jgi:hypothetical protein
MTTIGADIASLIEQTLYPNPAGWDREELSSHLSDNWERPFSSLPELKELVLRFNVKYYKPLVTIIVLIMCKYSQ